MSRMLGMSEPEQKAIGLLGGITGQRSLIRRVAGAPFALVAGAGRALAGGGGDGGGAGPGGLGAGQLSTSNSLADQW